MVGVPGRSKACNTCKKRKISCTFERPQCAQCVRSNRVCAGYHRERIFIQHREKVQDKIRTSHQAAYDETVHTKTSARASRASLLALRSEDISPSSSDSQYSQMMTVKEVHPSFVFQQQLLSEFLYHWLPSSGKSILGGKADKEENWLMLLPDLSTPTIALETSILAVCTAKLGRLYNAPVLINESARLYGQGLWELQKALWDPKLMYKDETLAACLALSLYEIIECPGKSNLGWLNHSGGCSRLIKLRGPEAHQELLGHSLFRTCRYSALINTIAEHRFTYLSSPRWCTLPWKEHPKSLSDKLVDIFAKGVDIVARADELAHSKSTDLVNTFLKITGQCWKLDAQLQEFYKEFECNSLGPLNWPQFSRMDNPADDSELGKVFPVALQFLNLQMAAACILYWTLCILLWSGLRGLYLGMAAVNLTYGATGEALPEEDNEGKKPSQPFDMRQLPPLEHRSDIIDLVRNICQSFEYCMQDEMRSMGPSVIIFPLQIVIENLVARPQNIRELLWAKAALEMVTDKGFGIVKVATDSNR